MRWFLILPIASVCFGAAEEEFFEARIRPLLLQRCAGCHGESAASGLRVDTPAGLRTGGRRGPAVAPGAPESSLLIQAVERSHATLRMPPDAPLPAGDVAALKEWVKAGARWPEKAKTFWAFEPPRTIQGTIDSVVQAALREKGIAPNPRADRRTLLRRVYADLTGLPPEPEQARTFLNDASPAAYTALVDRLLASPHFGERWGRHWLDVARFGEDDFTGTEPRPYPNAWRYRDWVIQAFNDDMPYDQFVRAQIAGDLQPGDNARFLGGLGLFGLGPWYFGITQPPQARADERHDRVDMVTRGFLGLTVACARCHDHKYDPISQKDYYALAGVFASSEYKEHPAASAEAVAAYDAAQKRIKQLEKEVKQFLAAQREQLVNIYAHQTANYLLSGPGRDDEIANRWYSYLETPEEDHPFLRRWFAASTDEERVAAARELQQLLLDVMEEKRVLDEENKRLVTRALDPTAKRRKIILPFQYDSDADFNPGADVVTKSLDRERYQLWNKIAGANSAVLRLDDQAVEKRLTGEWKRHLDGLRSMIAKLKKESPPAYPYHHGLTEHEEPVDLPLNRRGNPTDLGEVTPRRFPECLGGAPLREGSGRKQLAEAILDHPLAARVMSNRVWGWLMGNGVVRTPSNFGRMGDQPANRDLLELLAKRLKDHRYSLKALIREIVLSETYQASSAAAEEGTKLDPDNRLFWRANRKRLDAESIRDSLLAASGELDRTVGGESAALSDKNLRRTVYVRTGRYQQNETLALFDFPSASVHVEQRAVTNVPLQKLFFLNSSFVALRAEAFARRAKSVKGAYDLLFQREPGEKERQLGEAFLKGATWPQYAQVLLSSNEFQYID